MRHAVHTIKIRGVFLHKLSNHTYFCNLKNSYSICCKTNELNYARLASLTHLRTTFLAYIIMFGPSTFLHLQKLESNLKSSKLFIKQPYLSRCHNATNCTSFFPSPPSHHFSSNQKHYTTM